MSRLLRVLLVASLLANVGLLGWRLEPGPRTVAAPPAGNPGTVEAAHPAAEPVRSGVAPAADCEARLVVAAQRLSEIRQAALRSGPVTATFRLGEGDPRSTARVQGVIERLLARDKGSGAPAADSAVECRSGACRVEILAAAAAPDSPFEAVFGAPEVRTMSSEVMRGSSTLVRDAVTGKILRRAELLLKVKS
jgi:hypothetical protein